VRVLLLSTYELGAQPLGIAGPAAALAAAGHEVRTCDLAVEPWPTEHVAWAEAVACSVPMHTALRLGRAAIERLRRERPRLPVAFHGLYAPAAVHAGLLEDGDVALGGEVDGGLVAWLDALARGTKPPGGLVLELGRPRPPLAGPPPARAGLPGLASYAVLVDGGERRLAASVEASRGCNHRCRHCPVPVVYGGRSRALALDRVLADVEAVVAAGAGHLRFADPDFLNRPAHALAVARAVHERWPDLGFDITAKVSHLLEQPEALAELVSLGLRFVISAFESTSERVLARLHKGHRPADLGTAVALARSLGVEIRPSLLPFTPWTTRDDVVDLFDFVAAHDLVPNVDPVQLAIRLLLPPGSLLLEDPDPELAACLQGFEPDALGVRWRSADPLLDELQAALSARAEEAGARGEAAEDAYAALRCLAFETLGRKDPGPPPLAVAPGPPAERRPRLTEAWFCCAEPTSAQLAPLEAPR